MRKAIIVFLVLICGVSVSHAGTTITRYYRIQSGTGFFVNRMYIITNAHVVKGCNKVVIKGAVPEHEVSVKVIDADHDLALLESSQSPKEFAPLRFNIDDLRMGNRVFVVGYPGEAGARGEYKFTPAEVTKLADNVNLNPGQFYITDVLEHGNSGGPVFDGSGNVIGVVVAKSTLTTINKATGEKLAEQHVGVVISLATLKDFLYQQGAYTELSGAGVLFNDDYIEGHARDYIVNVQCRTLLDHPFNPAEEQNGISVQENQ